ncbi:MAG: RDD family protein [Jatrophihabitantaceae bacterium]
MSASPEIVSGEGVGLDLAHAGVGSRIVAASLDVALQLIASVALVAITAQLAGGDSAAIAAALVAELVLVFAGYPILMEWLSRGRTIGKLCMGLRVVRDDGGPIGFRQALVRGLAGLVLENPGLAFPFTTAAGIMTMIFSAREKRIGDMMAGTFVLNERAGPQHSVVARQFVVPYELQPWARLLDLSRLDDQLALAVRQFVVRANQMLPAAQHALGESLRARVEAAIAPAPPPGTPTPWVLTTVLAERRRRSDSASAHQYAQPGTPPPYPVAPPTYTAQPHPTQPAQPHPTQPHPTQPATAARPESPFTPPS